MSEQSEPRELTVLQRFWDGNQSTTRDFRANIIKVEDEEVAAVEEAITPAPKEESAPVPVDLPPVESTPTTQTSLGGSPENPAQTELSPTEKLEAAVAASGSPSRSSEDVPPLPQKVVQTPSDESSSQSSSTETNPGSSTPPAPVPPPAAAPPSPQTPTQTSP